MKKEPLALYYDIERFAGLASVWQQYETNVIKWHRHPMICSIAWQWAHEKQVYCVALPHFSKFYKENPFDNRLVMEAFHPVFDRADVTIAHNGRRFDEKHVRTEFAIKGMDVISPHYHVDTLRICKSEFGFESNSLSAVADRLGVKHKKMKHQGYDMWDRCEKGDPKAWANMILYNMQDIRVLREVEKRIGPWYSRYPDLSNMRRDWNCPYCGSSRRKFKSYKYNLASVKKQYRCLALGCGKYYLGPTEASKKTLPPKLAKGMVRK